MITIIYTAHQISELTKEIENIIRSSRIFVHENVFDYDKETETTYNKVSKGIIKPEDVELQSTYPEYDQAILQVLYRSRVNIRLERNKLQGSVDFTDNFGRDAINTFRQGKLDEALLKFRRYFERERDLDIRRDEDLAELLVAYQKSNKNGNITSIRGPIHTLAYHLVRKQGFPARMVFPYMPYSFWLTGEVSRKYIFGKKVDDISLLRIWACEEIGRFLEKKKETLAAYRQADGIVKQLDEERIRGLSEHISENWWPELDENILAEVVGDWLEQNGYA